MPGDPVEDADRVDEGEEDAASSVRSASLLADIQTEIAHAAGLGGAGSVDPGALFQDLGLDSIALVTLAGKISGRFGASFSPQKLLSLGTPAALARALRNAVTPSQRGAEARASTNGSSAGAGHEGSHEDPEIDEPTAAGPTGLIVGTLVAHLVLPKALERWRGRVSGLEHLPPSGPFLVAASHGSYFDHIALMATLVPELGRPLRFLAKAEHFEHPVEAALHRFAGAIPVDRSDGAEGLHAALDLLQQGEIVVIYPEGTRSRTGAHGEAQPGVGFLALATGLPVLPIRIDGAREVLPAGAVIPSTGRIHMTLGAPLRFEREEAPSPARCQEVADAVMERIVGGAPAAPRLRPDVAAPAWAPWRTDVPGAGPLFTDSGRIEHVRMREVRRPLDEAGVIAAVNDARALGVPVSIMGARRSQGGHSLAHGGLLIDPGYLSRIVSVDVEARTVTVQPGVTWNELRDALRPLGLTVKTSQSAGAFAVGPAVSVNAHGRDVDGGCVGATVRALRIVNAKGEVESLDRDRHGERLARVIGGFGLFGVVVEVTLDLVPDDIYERSSVVTLPIERYPEHVARNVLADPDVHFHFARLDIAESSLWTRAFAVSYRRVGPPEPQAAQGSAHGDRARMHGLQNALGLAAQSRFAWARRIRFPMEVALGADPVRAPRSASAQDWLDGMQVASGPTARLLQEYFVPRDRLLEFLSAARAVIADGDLTLLNTTIRVVPATSAAFLSYAPEPSFAVVLFFEQRLEDRALRGRMGTLRALLDCALAVGGRHYLPYQNVATREQVVRGYPALDRFFALKRADDPEGRFSSAFYAHYAKPEPLPAAAVAVDAAPVRSVDGQPLPPSQQVCATTQDGVVLPLVRYRGGSRGPVLLLAGLVQSPRAFAVEWQPESLALHLVRRGWDVWLGAYRTCPEVATCRGDYTLDGAARFDHPALVKQILAETGARDLQVVAHCMGAHTALMSRCLGHLREVRSMVALQVGLHCEAPLFSEAKARLGAYRALRLAGVRVFETTPRQGEGLAGRLLDRFLEQYPVSHSEQCDSPTCRRLTFLYGQLIRHANISETMHARMGELFGPASVHHFGQLARIIAAGHAVDSVGGDVYLPGVGHLDLPILFLHASENRAVGPRTTSDTLALLHATHGPGLHERAVLPGYGHLDAIVGERAHLDVFPRIVEHLARWA